MDGEMRSTCHKTGGNLSVVFAMLARHRFIKEKRKIVRVSAKNSCNMFMKPHAFFFLYVPKTDMNYLPNLWANVHAQAMWTALYWPPLLQIVPLLASCVPFTRSIHDIDAYSYYTRSTIPYPQFRNPKNSEKRRFWPNTSLYFYSMLL
jgi:hypothetical protein